MTFRPSCTMILLPRRTEIDTPVEYEHFIDVIGDKMKTWADRERTYSGVFNQTGLSGVDPSDQML